MALPSKEGRELIHAAMTEAYLLKMNRMAYEDGLIDRDVFIGMQAKIKVARTALALPHPDQV